MARIFGFGIKHVRCPRDVFAFNRRALGRRALNRALINIEISNLFSYQMTRIKCLYDQMGRFEGIWTRG